MKKFLQDLIARKQKELADLKKRSNESEDLNEVRSIGTQIDAINEEIRNAQAQLDDIEAKENEEAKKENEESRSAFNPNAALNVVAKASQNNNEARNEEEPTSTMEYRKAFKDYIQTGKVNRNVLRFVKRDGSNVTPVPEIVDGQNDVTGTSANLGVLIPMTVIQEIIKGVDKLYGQLYHRVRHLNVKGGIKFPVGSFSATFHRITEMSPVSPRQDAGGVTGYIEFSYNIGEIRLARTLLQTVLSVEAFERDFAEVVAEAYVKAMDTEIMTGDPENNEMTGIITEAEKASGSRIPASNVIEFTAAEMADWKSWQTKLFANIPLAMRNSRMEFVMTPNTYEANIKTLSDDNNDPVYFETYNPVDGTERATFKGREVVFVENDVFQNFNDAEDGEYFGMYWNPQEAYAINSNMEFSIYDYFDHETNQWVKKAIVINDGKVLKGEYIYLLKKKGTSAVSNEELPTG